MQKSKYKLSKATLFKMSKVAFVSTVFSVCIFSCQSTKKASLYQNYTANFHSVVDFEALTTDSFLIENNPVCQLSESKSPHYLKIKNNGKIIQKQQELSFIIPKNSTPVELHKIKYDDGRLPDGFSIASIVFALLGFPFAGKILGSIAVVLGIIGLFRTGKYKARTGKGYAIAGIILGIGAIVASFFIKNM